MHKIKLCDPPTNLQSNRLQVQLASEKYPVRLAHLPSQALPICVLRISCIFNIYIYILVVGFNHLEKY